MITHMMIHESFQNHFLFVRTLSQGHVLLLLYIDDMIVTGDDTVGITDTQRYLHCQFHMKDLGHLRYFLGLEIAQAEPGILISQQKCTTDIIDITALTDTKIVDTPLEVHSKFLSSDGIPPADPTRYHQQTCLSLFDETRYYPCSQHCQPVCICTTLCSL